MTAAEVFAFPAPQRCEQSLEEKVEASTQHTAVTGLAVQWHPHECNLSCSPLPSPLLSSPLPPPLSSPPLLSPLPTALSAQLRAGCCHPHPSSSISPCTANSHTQPELAGGAGYVPPQPCHQKMLCAQLPPGQQLFVGFGRVVNTEASPGRHRPSVLEQQMLFQEAQSCRQGGWSR